MEIVIVHDDNAAVEINHNGNLPQKILNNQALGLLPMGDAG